jgi:hypothetical protein
MSCRHPWCFDRSCDARRFADYLTRIAPLVVVPAHDLDEISIDHLSQAEIEHRRSGVSDDIGGDERIRRHADDAAVAVAGRLFSKDAIHFINGRRSGRQDDDVGERSDGKGRADG